MEAFYTKCGNSVEGELSLEGQNHIHRTRGIHITKLTQGKGVLICCAILSIGFVLAVALLSQNLINVSKEVSDTSLKFELIQAESRKELVNIQKSSGGLMANGNLTSVLEELAELKRENRKIGKDVVQMLEELYNLTGPLMANRNLTFILEELAELNKENGKLVLEELAELKGENERIAKDVIQLQEDLHNLTDFFCLTCPHNWQHFDRNCYFFSTSHGTWTSAKQSCEVEGAQLVMINNKAEQNFLAGQMIKNQVAWIGLSDAVTEGQWIWVDGTPMSLSFWRSGEPNNAGEKGEDCATLRFDGMWNDALCSNSDFWICEQKC